MADLLDARQRALLSEARRATLATIGPTGRPRLVPCCFAALDAGDGLVLVTPIDEKPKQAGDPRSLGRVRDIERDPRVSLLVDRWDEDWSHLAWLRLDGAARLVWPAEDPAGHTMAIAPLLARYPQYATHALGSLPVVRVDVSVIRGWMAASSD